MADIILGGSVGTTGTAILGRTTIEITGNTDYTLTSAQYANTFIVVTSDGASTGIRKVIAPLNEGSFFLVKNATIEGYPITFIGPTGTGVDVPLNIVALVNCDGTNFLLPNANSSTVAPVNAGAVETSGQPVTNTETLGAHLQIQQDSVGTQIDGTYGDGTLPWHAGVWTFLGHSIIRTPALDNTLPIMRIPLSTGSVDAWVKKPQWDKPSNKMYVPDNTGPRIYVIDTTPQIDPTGTYVAGCPGIVQTIDLSSTPVTTGFAMAANIATGTFWCFNGTQAVAIPFNGLTHQTFTLSNYVEDAVYANANVWVTTYNTSTFEQYVQSVNPSGSLNAGALVCSPTGAPGEFNQITYDLVNNVVWGVGNDPNVFGTLTMIGVDPVYPTPTVLYHWTDPAAGAAVQIITLYNGHIGLNTFVLGGGIEYSQTGTNLGYFDILGGGPWNEPSPFFLAAVYDPTTPQQYIFSANNVSAVIIRSAPGAGSGTIWAYAGGLQEWVSGGGGTNSAAIFVNEATLIEISNEAASSQLIQCQGSFPVLSGTGASLTADINTILTDVTGLSGFASSQNTEGGATITISGAADALNNGTFPFVQNYPSTNTGYYTNYTPGTLPDANNGSISWSIQYQAQFFFQNTGSIGPKLMDWSQVTGLEVVSTMMLSTTGSTPIDVIPALRISKLIMIGWDGTDSIYVTPIMTTSSGGGSGGTTSSLVFQPGGTATENIYVDEASLAAATLLLNSAPYTIFFDLSLVSGSYTFTTVGTLNIGTNGTWTDNGFLYNLTFANGTILSTLPSRVCGSLTISVTQTTDVCEIFGGSVFTLSDTAIINTSGANFINGEVNNRTIVCDNAVIMSSGHTALYNQYLFVYDAGRITSGAIDGSTYMYVCSLDANISPSIYASIQGQNSGGPPLTLTDTNGTAINTITPAVGNGSTIVNAVNGQVYVSNGTYWVTSISSTVTLNAGSPTSGNSFNNLTDLCAYIQNVGTAVSKWTVVVSGNVTITAGTYQLPNDIEFVGKNANGQLPYIQTDGGGDVIFDPPPSGISFKNLNSFWIQNTTSPVMTINSGVMYLNVDYATIFSTGSQGLMSLTNTSEMIGHFYNGILGGSVALIVIDSTSNIQALNLFDVSQINTGPLITYAGSTTNAVQIIMDSSSIVDPSLLTATGFEIVYADLGAQVVYSVVSPDINANWVGSPPTTIQQAIARIAALLGAGGSTPIP